LNPIAEPGGRSIQLGLSPAPFTAQFKEYTRDVLFNEKMLPLDEAAKLLPRGKSKSALYRWWRYGYLGVRLECQRIGRNLYTSPEALERFTTSLAATRENPTAEPEVHAELATLPLKRRSSSKTSFDAEAILQRAGIRRAG
jgi:hypothetical protein